MYGNRYLIFFLCRSLRSGGIPQILPSTRFLSPLWIQSEIRISYKPSLRRTNMFYLLEIQAQVPAFPPCSLSPSPLPSPLPAHSPCSLCPGLIILQEKQVQCKAYWLIHLTGSVLSPSISLLRLRTYSLFSLPNSLF